MCWELTFAAVVELCCWGVGHADVLRTVCPFGSRSTFTVQLDSAWQRRHTTTHTHTHIHACVHTNWRTHTHTHTAERKQWEWQIEADTNKRRGWLSILSAFFSFSSHTLTHTHFTAFIIIVFTINTHHEKKTFKWRNTNERKKVFTVSETKFESEFTVISILRH